MSIEECLRLERQTHAAKIQHWSQEKPWDGLKLPKKLPFIKSGHIQLDAAGNISRMPPLIGRPCFGQVTAYLRHGGHQPFWNPKVGQWMNSRCMRCPVRDACEYVCEERLRVTPAIEKAYREWRANGGRNSTWSKPSGSMARIKYRDLLDLLKTTVAFSNSNDEIAIAHCEKVIEDRRIKDRDRKWKNRLRAQLESARAGEFDADVVDVLTRQRIWRQVQHMQARAHPNGPMQLKRVPDDASLFDSHAWVAKTMLELRGAAVNASSIATVMQSQGFDALRSQNALRDRVRRALTRIALLERLHLPGRSEPVWPAFGHRELREDLAFDPLQTRGP
jgi:hypothetical protein